MVVNETRNSLVTDILLNIRKSAKNIWKRCNSTISKKVEYPFKKRSSINSKHVDQQHLLVKMA